MFGLMELMAAASLASAAPAVEQPVRIGEGVQELHGSLLTTGPAPKRAAVLMIAGSGPEDRNGDDLKDGQRSQTMRLLALGLQGQGIATLRYDKRGVGESAAAGTATSVGQLVDEAVAWARFLQRQPGVGCVVLLGHSEGALIGTLAAQKVRICGLVLVSGTSRNLGDLIESQLALVRLPPEIQARAHAIIADLRAGKPATDVPPQLARLFGPDAEAYTASEISIDPVAEAAKVKVPVLVLQGDNDLQASVPDAQALSGASRGKLVVIPEMNHVLKVAPKNPVGNFMTYGKPDLPLAPGVIPAIADFVRDRR
jgi:pimeloyl-ACP methyl ester carboxylesterase